MNEPAGLFIPLTLLINVPQSSHSNPLGAFDHMASVLSVKEASTTWPGDITSRFAFIGCKSGPAGDWKLLDSSADNGGPMVENIESKESEFGIANIDIRRESRSSFVPLEAGRMVDGPACESLAIEGAGAVNQVLPSAGSALGGVGNPGCKGNLPSSSLCMGSENMLVSIDAADADPLSCKG